MKPQRNWYALIGFVLAVGGAVSYFLLVMTQDPAVHRWLRVPAINLLVVALGIILSGIAVYRAFARTHRGRVIAPLLATVSLTVAAAFSWWLFVFSYDMPVAAKAPAVGAVAPDFALLDERGNEVRLSSLRGSPVVLIFYRGFW